MDIGVIPTIWKTSVVVPVPKMSSPSELNHFRPVALTSIVMKCFERLILSHILPQKTHMYNLNWTRINSLTVPEEALTMQ